MTTPAAPSSHNSTGPALSALAVTPNDGADLSERVRSVTINTGGTLAYHNWRGVTCTTAALPAGTYPLLARRVLATGTTATGITGWV